MSTLLARMQAVAAEFDAVPTRCFVDPAKALANRPCLLVTPPVISYGQTMSQAMEWTWGVMALSSHPAGTLDAVKELSALVDVADEVLEIETARPVRYTLTAKGDPVAAYLCTHTEIEE
jgi:hypothetical protein